MKSDLPIQNVAPMPTLQLWVEATQECHHGANLLINGEQLQEPPNRGALLFVEAGFFAIGNRAKEVTN